MERPRTDITPTELPESADNSAPQPQEAPELALTDDEIESISQLTDPTLRAILGLC
jgi:hypothetical protein